MPVLNATFCFSLNDYNKNNGITFAKHLLCTRYRAKMLHMHHLIESSQHEKVLWFGGETFSDAWVLSLSSVVISCVTLGRLLNCLCLIYSSVIWGQ